MGNRVSTARKLGKTVAKDSSIHRSNVNQLPSETLKEKFAQGPQEKKSVPEGKDGSDPQEHDFIKYMTTLGSKIESATESKKVKLNSVALNQIKNRNLLYKHGEAQRTQAAATQNYVVNPKELTAIIEDLHDATYENENITKRFNLKEDFLNNLSRFKVASNFKVLEEAVKEDEIGHQGVFEQRTFDQDAPMHSDKPIAALKDRISVDK